MCLFVCCSLLLNILPHRVSSFTQINQASPSQKLAFGKQEVTHHPSDATLKKLPLRSLRPLGGSPGSAPLEAMLTSRAEGPHWRVLVRPFTWARVYIWVSVSRKGAPQLCGSKTHFSCGFNKRKFLGWPQAVLWKSCPAGIDSGCLFLLSVWLLALCTVTSLRPFASMHRFNAKKMQKKKNLVCFFIGNLVLLWLVLLIQLLPGSSLHFVFPESQHGCRS